MKTHSKSRPAAQPPPQHRRYPAQKKPLLGLLCVLLAAAIVGVYWRVLQNGFINFDDDIYIYANEHIRHGLNLQGLRWAFTSVSYVYFQPVTWISHMLDVTWFGLNPAGHHAVSVLLHTATAVMLLVWLFQTTGHLWRSACAAALFALHPLRVESVAWAAERKDVLSTFFLLITLLLYWRYSKRPSASRYALMAAAFMLGLLSKPTMVAAPFLLLLADYWPLRRTESLARLIREKLPLFALAAFSAWLTYLGQAQAGAMRTLGYVPFVVRTENAIFSYARYLGKTVWPHPLTALYPYNQNLPIWGVTASAALLLAVTAALVRARKTYPFLLAGWLWFIAGLVPSIGLVQVGMQSMADRFSYIPSIGLLTAIVWGAASLAERFHWPPKLMAAVAVSSLIVLSAASWVQLGYWRDSITLLQYTVDHTGPNPLAEEDLGVALGERNRNAEASMHLAAAIRLQPNFFQGHYNLGKSEAALGQVQPAIASFSQALRLNPAYGEAYYARALMYEKAGQEQNAVRDLRQAIENGLAPFYLAEAYNNLGVLAARCGDVAGAAAKFEQAVRVRPDFPDAQVNLSTALTQSGRREEAVARLTAALAATHGASAVRNALARLQAKP